MQFLISEIGNEGPSEVTFTMTVTHRINQQYIAPCTVSWQI
jgi:hypothetical protein